MKRRVRKIANFFAFNLLFFALYLNFIHKDNLPTAGDPTPTQNKTASFNGTVPVDNPEVYLEKKNDAGSTVRTDQTVPDKSTAKDGSALKLSIN